MTKVGELLGGGNETREQMAKVLELEGELAKVNHCSIYLTKIFKQSSITMVLKRQFGCRGPRNEE